MARSLNVYLLIAGPARRLFYSEVAPATDDDGADDDGPPATGLRGWLDRVFRRAGEGLRRSEAGPARRCRAVWDWLHRWAHPDEALYARLRRARRIDLSYPEALGEAEARAEWARFLVRGRWRHWPWLLVNLALAPVSVLLAPVPGPNLIGYWFVYRAIHHLYILHGLGRVRAGRVAVEFQGVEALDGPLTEAARLGCDPAELRGFLERQGVALAAVAAVEGGPS